MSAVWAHCPSLPPAAPASIRLADDESRHAGGSRRLRAGDPITLFNGDGLVGEGTIAATSDGTGLDVALTLVRRAAPPEPIVDVASALPKGDRIASLLEALGPLGARRFVPLTCERSIVAWSDSMRARAERVLVASCKQARQPFVPTIASRSTLVEAVQASARERATVLLAHPDGEPISSVAHALRTGAAPCASQSVLVVVGPEGGLAPLEVASARDAGAIPISLGKSILRIELAVACALAAFRA